MLSPAVGNAGSGGVDNRWIAGAEAVDNLASAHDGTADHLHRLTTMAWDLELSEARDVELGSAFVADQEHLELLDVLDLGLGAIETASRDRAEHAGTYSPDHEREQQRRDDEEDLLR